MHEFIFNFLYTKLIKIRQKMKSFRNLAQKSVSNFGWNNYIQKPGEGTPRKVTLVPGHGIGPEITSKKIAAFH